MQNDVRRQRSEGKGGAEARIVLTKDNIQGPIKGIFDLPMSPNGVEEVETSSVREVMKKRSVVVVDSPMRRVAL